MIVVTATIQAWQEAQTTGEYKQSTITSTLEDIGFIHATFPDQTTDMIKRHFTDRDDVVLLLIDAEKVKSPIKYESALSGRVGIFPHIYGPLNIDAVLTTAKPEKDSTGNFNTLEELNSTDQKPL